MIGLVSILARPKGSFKDSNCPGLRMPGVRRERAIYDAVADGAARSAVLKRDATRPRSSLGSVAPWLLKLPRATCRRSRLAS